ncbi:MAG: tRNA (N(6)-L-threonylcarbamoyladenosine(37)-C(2))-methylthiotransferase MtaB [bacterium]|nr:tRNA (N(6)-L-threonylcarbamoyladenosine(37)-C(2))-methylthiotransferase MtaB [bacterium]
MSEELQKLIPLSELAPKGSSSSAAVKVAFWTLGCRLNQYDTEGLKTAMNSRFLMEVVPWKEKAHVYVLNSCTVTHKADQECRRLARQAKRRHPESKVVVAGCYAQTQPEALSNISEIDAVIGNANKDDVEQWLPQVLGQDHPLLAVDDFQVHPVFDSPVIDSFTGRSRAFVKIQDGCNLRCTYCLIWQARGPGRSRTQEDIFLQLQALVDNGYSETILAGIHLGGYGRDLSPRLPLVDLLRNILQRFPQLRIRLSSIHPNEVSEELLDLYRQHENMRPHLHISLQSGSSTVLKRMKRPYGSDRAWEALKQVSAANPEFGIGADIIVGFPGETDEEFEETRRMVEDLPFSYLHVFRFSPRPGTPAAEMKPQISPQVITHRSEVLRQLAARKKEEFEKKFIGSVREVVIEADGGRDGFKNATTDNYLSVLVEGDFPAGTLAQVEITCVSEGSLIGKIKQILNENQGE